MQKIKWTHTLLILTESEMFESCMFRFYESEMFHVIVHLHNFTGIDKEM